MKRLTLAVALVLTSAAFVTFALTPHAQDGNFANGTPAGNFNDTLSSIGFVGLSTNC